MRKEVKGKFYEGVVFMDLREHASDGNAIGQIPKIRKYGGLKLIDKSTSKRIIDETKTLFESE